MSVTRCHVCDQNPEQKRLYGRQGYEDGQTCPICYQSTCRYCLTTVRWRWRSNGSTDSALVCKECKKSYAHRQWDSFNRDWIT